MNAKLVASNEQLDAITELVTCVNDLPGWPVGVVRSSRKMYLSVAIRRAREAKMTDRQILDTILSGAYTGA